MRQRLEQRAVLQARGLALGGVDHDDRAPARGSRPRASCGRRKAGAAATAQARALDLARSAAPTRSRAPVVRALAAGSGPWTARCSLEAQRAVGRDARQQPRQRRCRRGLFAAEALRARRSSTSDGAHRGSRSSRWRRGSGAAARWACPSAAPIRSPAGRSAATAGGTARRPRRRRGRRCAAAGAPASRDAPAPAPRPRRRPGRAMLSASSHVLLTSLPVPKPCSSAIGQLA